MEGHRIWARHYETTENPLLALESRILGERLGSLDGVRVLDLACGTGRWMRISASRGARAFGVDFCLEMLQETCRRAQVSGWLTLGEAARLPFAAGCVEKIICAFSLGYFPEPQGVIREMARVCRPNGTVWVTDVHPAGWSRGWTRSFRSGDTVYEIEHHPYTIESVRDWGERAGLRIVRSFEPHFGEEEERIFARAGRAAEFPRACRLPAVLLLEWKRV